MKLLSPSMIGISGIIGMEFWTGLNSVSIALKIIGQLAITTLTVIYILKKINNENKKT